MKQNRIRSESRTRTRSCFAGSSRGSTTSCNRATQSGVTALGPATVCRVAVTCERYPPPTAVCLRRSARPAPRSAASKALPQRGLHARERAQVVVDERLPGQAHDPAELGDPVGGGVSSIGPSVYSPARAPSSGRGRCREDRAYPGRCGSNSGIFSSSNEVNQGDPCSNRR